MPSNLVKIDLQNPQDSVLRKAAAILKQGGIVAFPTDTSYGLAVDPFNDQAVDKVYTLKGRDFNKPLLLLIGEQAQLGKLAKEIAPDIAEVIEKFWPGALTMVFEASENLMKYKIGSSGKIGVRLPNSQVVHSLVNAAQIPITATSANPSGKPSAFSAEDVLEYFGDKVDLIIDGGISPQTSESTVLDVSIFPAKVLRSGIVSVDELSTVIPLA